MELYKGEQESFTTYIYDEDGETKIDPTTLDDVIIWLYTDYTKELVNVYSISGNTFTREGIEYSPETLTVNGNDLEFTVESSDTENITPGNVIFQLDEKDGGSITNKYTGVIFALKDAK